MRRADVWLVEYDDPAPSGEPAKLRPALVVSADRLNASRSGSVVAVPLTTSKRGHPLHVEIDGAGLDATSYAQVELVGAASRERFVRLLGAADLATMAAVNDRLRLVLDL